MDLESNNLYKVFFGVINEGLILVDDKAVIVKVNIPGAKMFGYEVNELIGQKIETLVPTGKRDTHQSQREGYNERPTARLMGANLRLDGVRKDGTEFPVQVSLNPFVSPEGHKYVVALVSDVTERRENEEELQRMKESLELKVRERTRELRESENLHKSIARNFPSGVISIFDRSYKYLFAEGQGLYELGIESADLIGIDYLDRIDEVARKKVKKELDEVFKGTPRNFEIEVGNRTYLLNATPLSFDNDVVDKILVVEQNVSRQKEVARKLEETLNKERELTEMKSRFVSMASHEFRTPLTTINSSASLILKYVEKEDLEKIPKHSERIKNAVHNLTSILNDFLSFEKLEAGKVNARFTEQNLPEVLFETFEDMTESLKPNQKIVYKGPKELTISTDELMLKNTVINLLSNAVKYSKVGTDIIVGVEDLGDRVKVVIQDFGVGIPEKDQKNLFTRFFRAGNVTNIEGTGLGLNIVLRYLDLLNGDISFESKEAEGTTFFITLPKN